MFGFFFSSILITKEEIRRQIEWWSICYIWQFSETIIHTWIWLESWGLLQLLCLQCVHKYKDPLPCTAIGTADNAPCREHRGNSKAIDASSSVPRLSLTLPVLALALRGFPYDVMAWAFLVPYDVMLSLGKSWHAQHSSPFSNESFLCVLNNN